MSLSPEKCISLVWELTEEVWSFKGAPVLNDDYRELLQIFSEKS